ADARDSSPRTTYYDIRRTARTRLRLPQGSGRTGVARAMLHHPPTRRSLPRRRPHLAAPPRRQDGLDAARRTAQRSRDARDRLWAGALETLVTFIPATVALAFTVDDRRLRLPAMAYTGTNGGEFAEAEAIDPFAVLRAELRGARVLSAADVEDVERSLYGRHLARNGFGIPLC